MFILHCFLLLVHNLLHQQDISWMVHLASRFPHSSDTSDVHKLSVQDLGATCAQTYAGCTQGTHTQNLDSLAWDLHPSQQRQKMSVSEAVGLQQFCTRFIRCKWKENYIPNTNKIQVLRIIFIPFFLLFAELNFNLIFF